MEAIIVAIITGVCAVIGNAIIYVSQRSKEHELQAVRDAVLDQRLATIEKKVDEHNGYAKCFHEIQTDIAVIRTEIAGIKGAK